MSKIEVPENVAHEFLVAALGDNDIGMDTDIFELQYVTSLFALELVTFVERRFALTIDMADLDLANFRSAARIGAFVRQKRQAGASPPAEETVQ